MLTSVFTKVISQKCMHAGDEPIVSNCILSVYYTAMIHSDQTMYSYARMYMFSMILLQFSHEQQKESSKRLSSLRRACFGPSTVKVGHVNVRTLSPKQAGPGKAECFAVQLLQRDLAVCGLSEVRWPGTGQQRIGQYTIHDSGLATNKAQHGVSIALTPAAS